MADVSKKIKVTGYCDNCRRNAEAWVTAKGPKGHMGDWRGKGICPKCNKPVFLEKKNIKF